MNIKKCNKCGKILDKETDYFTLDEVSFHKGSKDEKSIRVHFSDDKAEKNFELNESWVYYTDIDFCVECFKKENLSKYLK